jgi:quinohemoprotein amine dehydrogenase
MLRSKNWFVAGLLALLAAGFAQAQEPGTTVGIPIDHQLTINKCGGCHQRDTATGMMRRLSYIRTSPEVWEQAIKRMVRLNDVVMKPEEARDILRYLSSNNGLAPEEAKPVFWEAEHRLFRDQSDKIPSDALQHTCNYCHTIGRVLTQRRTRDDYEKLINMHLGLFPGAENTLKPRRPGGPQAEAPVVMSAPTGGNPAIVPPPPAATALRNDGKYPADVAVDYLSTAQPLITPEWSAWKAVMRTPKMDGKWMLTGYQQGKGRVFGTMTIEAGASPEDFTTKIDIEYASTGATLSRTGKGIVYTGYGWRGRSTAPTPATPSSDPSSNPAEWREALFISRDSNTMDGRWFWGGYDEFGIDAHLTRIGTTPILAGARAGQAGIVLVSARYSGQIPVLPGTLEGVIGVDVDWNLPRDRYRVSEVNGSPCCFASGFPRPLPGVPPARNLNGISFAVANMTGFVARACEGLEQRSLDSVLRLLTAETQKLVS